MKSLAELAEIREKMKDQLVIRQGVANVHIVVGMATCGIAAGARSVLHAFVEGVDQAGLNGQVSVSQTGCIGLCQYEPIVEVIESGKEKVTYVKMTVDKAEKVLKEHIKGGKIVQEYTIANAQNV